MDNITIGDIRGFLTIVVGLITSTGIIVTTLKKLLKTTLKEELKPIEDELNRSVSELKDELVEIKTDVKEVDRQATKNYLSKCLNDIRQGQTLSETNMQRFYENFDRYTNVLGGNSYLHKEFEDLRKEGKL